MIFDAHMQPLHPHLSFMKILTDSSFAPFGQVSRKLCFFKPWQSREPLPRPLLCQGVVSGQCPTQIAISLSSHLQLRCSWAFLIISLRVWEAFPKPKALIHTKITWALSPTVPQVPGVTPGSPLCPWCLGLSSWRGARQRWCPYYGIIQRNDEHEIDVLIENVAIFFRVFH